MEKRKWSRPVLLVLIRGRKEELVLEACKTTASAAASSDDNNGCKTGGPACGTCNDWASS